MTVWQNIAVALMTGLIIAPVSAFIGAKIALRQKTQETWWGRRLDCYVGLVTHLQRLTEVCASRARYFEKMRVPNDDEKRRWTTIEDDANAEIKRCWNLSRLLLRSDVSRALEKYYDGVATALGEQDAASAQIVVVGALQSAISEIIDIAKRDLSLPK
jgi:hypothetical protein